MNMINISCCVFIIFVTLKDDKIFACQLVFVLLHIISRYSEIGQTKGGAVESRDRELIAVEPVGQTG